MLVHQVVYRQLYFGFFGERSWIADGVIHKHIGQQDWIDGVTLIARSTSTAVVIQFAYALSDNRSIPVGIGVNQTQCFRIDWLICRL